MNDDIQAKLDEIARKRAEIAKLEASLRSRLVTEEAFKACGVPFDPEDTLGLGPISAARPTRHQDDRTRQGLPRGHKIVSVDFYRNGQSVRRHSVEPPMPFEEWETKYGPLTPRLLPHRYQEWEVIH